MAHLGGGPWRARQCDTCGRCRSVAASGGGPIRRCRSGVWSIRRRFRAPAVARTAESAFATTAWARVSSHGVLRFPSRDDPPHAQALQVCRTDRDDADAVLARAPRQAGRPPSGRAGRCGPDGVRARGARCGNNVVSFRGSAAGRDSVADCSTGTGLVALGISGDGRFASGQAASRAGGRPRTGIGGSPPQSQQVGRGAARGARCPRGSPRRGQARRRRRLRLARRY